MATPDGMESPWAGAAYLAVKMAEAVAAMGAFAKESDEIEDLYGELRVGTEVGVLLNGNVGFNRQARCAVITVEPSDDGRVGYLGVRVEHNNYWQKLRARDNARASWESRKRAGVAALPDRRFIR